VERLTDYDYTLPEDLIAQTPLADRSASRLLHLDRAGGGVTHRRFAEVPHLLRAGDLLVVNDTRVDAMRLFGRKPTGGEVEALLLHRTGERTYEALLRPGRRLPVGSRIEFGEGVTATVVEERSEGRKVVEFAGDRDWRSRLGSLALAPLPPYIHEPLGDRERYQTVYAAHEGSAAAPTAGLHFTSEILDALRSQGIEVATVTLHVGLDTFRPVSTEDPAQHPIHGEWCAISEETALKIAGASGRIIAVGTTSVRTLESFAIGPRQVEAGVQVSSRYIRPGYEFRVVDGMFTNFHMPRTTMLMMLSAMAGREAVMNAYSEAIRERYRFLSFGDSMLII
jgi:S-adenosylmethionine:tRNA ribosyltransferase-isomerase